MPAYYLPEEDVINGKRNAFQMLKDIWWRLCTKAGNILNAPIVRYGPDGKPNGETSAAAEFGWNRENVSSIKWSQEQARKELNDKLDRIITKLGA